MKYGISFTHLLGPSPSAGDVIAFARAAEDAGFHSVAVSDHVLLAEFDASRYPAGTFPPDVYWYDPFVVLAAIAGATTSIRLGTGIAVVPYRPAIQQAQAVASLDFMSGGRFFYGIGLGWMREEFAALGVPFSERGRRTDEYLAVMKLLWSGSGEGFHGEFVDFDGGRISPRPLSKPHPPILVGGETPAALQRIARHGDGFCINWKSLTAFRALLDALAPCLTAQGRQLSDLYMQLACTDPDLVRAERGNLGAYEELGLTEITFMPVCDSLDEGLDLLHELADEFI
jgi:probable F420-dependent oxidoreductase